MTGRPEGAPPPCDPRLVFELADGALTPAEEGEARAHVAACPGCRERYEREVALSARLRGFDLPAEEAPSVCRGVAMELPTRRLGARLMWAALALALLAAALVALDLSGANPAVPLMAVLGEIWSFATGLAEAGRTFVAAAGYVLLAALAVGALLDLAIAAALLARARSRTREA